MNTHSSICVCGHPVDTHWMVGTEYASCQPTTGVKCYCFGGERTVVQLTDVREGRGSSWSGGVKLFHRKIRVGKDGRYESALQQSLARAVEKGYGYEWVVDNCDRCERNTFVTGVHIRMRGADGSFLLRLSRGEDFTGQYGVICGLCDGELRFTDGG